MARGQEPNAKQVIAQLRGLFRGVVKQYDPGALLAGELQDAQNARLVDGNLVCRGGQSKVNGTTPVSGSPLAIFDDWTGAGPEYPVYGGFQGSVMWDASDTEPNYYQAFYDFDGLTVTVSLIPRDASLLPGNFFPVVVQPVKVGAYWYTVLKQASVPYGGTNYAQWFMIARALPGESFVQVDLFSPARQEVTTGAVNWTNYTITHDGDVFIISVRAVDTVAPYIYETTYQTSILRITLDGTTAPERVGHLLADINATITANGGTAITLGGNSPPFGVVYYGGYLLAYPLNCIENYLDAVGSTRPGYAAYMAKGGDTWLLVNPTTSPIADGAIGRVRWHVVHDGKLYLLTATDHDLNGSCILRVWDPATAPSVVSAVFTLTGGRRWLTYSPNPYGGGNAISYQGKLYFSWSTGTTIGVGSWDGTTLVEDVWSTTWSLNAAYAVWLMPMQTGLAVMILDTSYTPDRQKIFYSQGTDLSSWSSISVEGIERNFWAVLPEEL